MLEEKTEKNNVIGIITYDVAHLKTEQIVMRILYKPWHRWRIKLFMLPFQARKTRAVLVQHRPEQFGGVGPTDIARLPQVSVQYLECADVLAECDYVLVGGAGLLPDEIVQRYKVINAHPGIIPAARGLDSFKWSILKDIPLGVTLHYLDNKVDAGEILTVVRTPIFKDDSIESLARRHYENEIDALVNFLEHMNIRRIDELPESASRMRMPIHVEEEMINHFPEYRNKMSDNYAAHMKSAKAS
jgi:phosphoribosylglycinamide formyltransferase-1